jgi:putative tricarboxylic transport membrane protein
MLDFFLHVVSGIVLGALTGILPGVGISIILLGAWPFLINSGLILLFVFYISLLTTSQYFGSVSAILYGVMGETTSAPAVKYGNPMFKKGLGIYCLKYTAYASLIASVLAVGMSSVVIFHYEFLQTMLTGHVRIVIITLLFIILITINSQPYLSALLLCIGLTLATVGFNNLLQQHIIVNTYSVIDGGIPFIPIMIGLLVVPILLQEIKKNYFRDIVYITQKSYSPSWIPTWAIIRGTAVGFVCGLVPGVSYTISSNLAAALESKISAGKIRPLIAAEAANNSAAVSAILPVLIFAIPVVPSEVILLAMAEMSGFTNHTAIVVLKEYWLIIILSIISINGLAFLIARTSYTWFLKIFDFVKAYIYYGILFSVIAVAILIGGQYNDIFLASIVLVISTLIGIYIKNFDAKVVGVIGFLLSDQYLSEIYRQLLIKGFF